MKSQTKRDWDRANAAGKSETSMDTLRKRYTRRGRPVLIHDTAKDGTFVGNLKEHYKFGPAFNNKDRREATDFVDLVMGKREPVEKVPEKIVKAAHVEQSVKAPQKGLFRRVANIFRRKV